MTHPAAETPEEAKAEALALRKRVDTNSNRVDTVHDTLKRMRSENHFGRDVARAVKGYYS